MASSLTPLPFGLRWLARSAHDATQVTPSVWCNGFATVKRLHMIISPWANTFALCAELPSDQPTTVD
ncbi:hypothetical protein HUC41_07350 [Escherichia coli]|nr:hypothetical protein [Escherichia coli]